MLRRPCRGPAMQPAVGELAAQCLLPVGVIAGQPHVVRRGPRPGRAATTPARSTSRPRVPARGIWGTLPPRLKTACRRPRSGPSDRSGPTRLRGRGTSGQLAGREGEATAGRSPRCTVSGAPNEVPPNRGRAGAARTRRRSVPRRGSAAHARPHGRDRPAPGRPPSGSHAGNDDLDHGVREVAERAVGGHLVEVAALRAGMSAR